jgi:hypothetical protein
MGLHEIKKFLHDRMAAHRMGKNLCQLYIWQGINSQNIPGAQKTKLQRINDPMTKWTNKLNRAFSKEEVQMAKTHK